MELHEALTQISEIRLQIARSERFRGYRAAPIALSGALAWLAAACQAVFIPRPDEQLNEYLLLWIAVAIVSGSLSLVDVWLRHRRGDSALRTELTRLAIEQFSPCVVAGGLVTAAIVAAAPTAAWMLPGLWSVLFSLGMFASYRLLPKPMFAVAVYYLLGGVVCLTLGPAASLAPWTMAVLFGGGQLAFAAILVQQERHP